MSLEEERLRTQRKAHVRTRGEAVNVPRREASEKTACPHLPPGLWEISSCCWSRPTGSVAYGGSTHLVWVCPAWPRSPCQLELFHHPRPDKWQVVSQDPGRAIDTRPTKSSEFNFLYLPAGMCRGRRYGEIQPRWRPERKSVKANPLQDHTPCLGEEVPPSKVPDYRCCDVGKTGSNWLIRIQTRKKRLNLIWRITEISVSETKNLGNRFASFSFLKIKLNCHILTPGWVSVLKSNMSLFTISIPWQ